MSRLDTLTDQVSPNILASRALLKDVDQDKDLARGLLKQGHDAQKVRCLAKKHRRVGELAHQTRNQENDIDFLVN